MIRNFDRTRNIGKHLTAAVCAGFMLAVFTANVANGDPIPAAVPPPAIPKPQLPGDGSSPGEQRACTLALQCKAYRNEKKFDAAIKCENELIAVEKKFYGPKHIFIAYDFKMLGDIQKEAGLNKDAASSFRKAIPLGTNAEARELNSCIVAKDVNEDCKATLILDCYQALTDVLEKDNDLDGAEDAYKQALATSEAVPDMNVFWIKSLLEKDYIKFLDRNGRDTTKAKQQWHSIELTHEANHEYRPGDGPEK